jgi:3-mercaptopyruvate sulfurtransferase SseA
MRILSSLAFLVVAVVAVFAFGACNSTERTASKVAPGATPSVGSKTNPTAPAPPDNARRVNVQQAQDLAARGQAFFVDVRNQAAFDQGHIRGAKLIPLGEVAARTGELPRDKTIITYCS